MRLIAHSYVINLEQSNLITFHTFISAQGLFQPGLHNLATLQLRLVHVYLG